MTLAMLCLTMFAGFSTTTEEPFDLATLRNPFIGEWQSDIPSANTTLIFDYKNDGTFDYEMVGVPADQGGKGSGAYLVSGNTQVSYLPFEGAAGYDFEVVDNDTINVTEFELDEAGQKVFGNTAPFTRVPGSDVNKTDVPTLLPDTALTANKWSVNVPEGSDPKNISYPSTWEFSDDGTVVVTFLGMGEILGFDSADAPYPFTWTIYDDLLIVYTASDEGNEIKQLHFSKEADGNLIVTGFAGDTEMEVAFTAIK